MKRTRKPKPELSPELAAYERLVDAAETKLTAAIVAALLSRRLRR
jgi:hypothetical protein